MRILFFLLIAIFAHAGAISQFPLTNTLPEGTLTLVDVPVGGGTYRTRSVDINTTLATTVGGGGASASADWTICIVPDTQYLTQSTFDSMGDYLTANASAMNLGMVIGVGDVADDGSVLAQWNNSTNLYWQAIGLCPTFVASGNHDYDSGAGNVPANRLLNNFNSYYGPSFYTGRTWLKSSGTYEGGKAENSWYIVERGGEKWMVMILEFGPRNAVLTWAAGIIDANPYCRVILVTHAYLKPDGTRDGLVSTDTYSPKNYAGIASDCNDGNQIYEKLLKTRPNIHSVVCGHYLGSQNGEGRAIAKGSGDNTFAEMYSDYQEWGTTYGAMRFITVRPNQNRIDVKTYLTSTSGYLTESRNQFTMETMSTIPRIYDEIPLNEEDPTRGLIFAVPFWEGYGTNPVEVVSGVNGLFRAQTTFPTWGTGGPLGNYLQGNNNGSVKWEYSWRFHALPAITVSCWVKLNSTSDGGVFASLHGASTTGSFYLGSLANNTIRFTVINSTPTRQDHDVVVSDLYNNEWHQITATWVPGTVEIWVDGNKVLSTSSVTGTMNTYTGSIVLGDYAGNDGTWDASYIIGGGLDDVRIWNRKLSDREIFRVSTSGMGKRSARKAFGVGDTINLRADCGGRGVGVDDQAAWDYAISLIGSQGGHIKIDSGDWVFNAGIVKDGVDIEGAGAVHDEALTWTNRIRPLVQANPVFKYGNGTSYARSGRLRNVTLYGGLPSTCDTAVELAGGAVNVTIDGLVAFRFKHGVVMKASGTIESTCNHINRAIIRMPSDTDGSHAFEAVMPSGNTASYYTTETLITNSRIFGGTRDSDTCYAVVVDSTYISAVNLYCDLYPYGRGLEFLSGSGETPQFYGFNVHLDDSGSASDRNIVRNGINTTKALSELIKGTVQITGPIQVSDGSTYSDGQVMKFYGGVNPVLEQPEIIDWLGWTRPGDATYSGWKTNASSGRSGTAVAHRNIDGDITFDTGQDRTRATRVIGGFALTAGSTQTVTAGGGVTPSSGTVKVAGSGGAVTVTATPSIPDALDGCILFVIGTSDSNTVTLQDQGTLANSNLELQASTRVLGNGDVLCLVFDGTTTLWREVSFANN